MNNYKHWVLTEDEHKIIWLGLDRQDTAVNSLNDEVLDELNLALQDIAKLKQAKGLILHSLKDKGFIAGADIHQFTAFGDKATVSDFLRKGQVILSRLESIGIPSLAMIDGFCLGGGFELALACDYRIATEDSRLGLPEVLLGIHPGWGGMVRLPKLIGGFQALSQVILPGSFIRAKRAKQLGMIDVMVPLRQLKRAAVQTILSQPEKHKPSFWQSLTNQSWARRQLAKLIRKTLAKKVQAAHYPAPYAALDFWVQNWAVDERAYRKEADSVERLVTESDTALNLIRAFLLKERMKAFAKDSDAHFCHVHVIGAGVMGGDIAAFCAMKGLKVTLQDKSYAQIAPAMGRAEQLFKKKLRQDRLVQAARDRLIPDPEGQGVAKADVIIEAIFENLQVKQDLMQQIEAKAKATAIIASNTSSIPLDEINQVMKQPERLVGIHFFNPVAQMELVEIVFGEKTSKAVEQAAAAFVGQIGKLPLPVKSSPGFLVNRVLMPYLLECVQLLEEGYAPEVIDRAAQNFGMVMGPVELADTVGLDVCLAVARNLTAHFGGKVPAKIETMVEAGNLGRKNGKGFYQYKQGKPQKRKLPPHADEVQIADRLIMRMVNESKACLQESVVADADLLDGGMIFAAGFAPFRGGPMHYANGLGKTAE